MVGNNFFYGSFFIVSLCFNTMLENKIVYKKIKAKYESMNIQQEAL